MDGATPPTDPTAQPLRPQLSGPLSRAWQRTRGLLFEPFRLELWLVLGLSAWLGGLFQGSGSPPMGGGDFSPSGDWGSGGWGFGDWDFGISELSPELLWVIGCVAVAVVVLLALVVLFVWLKSRFAFIFIDNLVSRRAEIQIPWKEYRREGNSLFLFWVGLYLAAFLIFGTLIALTVYLLVTVSENLGCLYLAALMAILIPIGIVAFFAVVFLEHFVVPIMARQRIDALEACRRFMALFGQYPVSFLLYGLLILGFSILLSIAILVVGILTCCVGLILVSLPYVSGVVLLPIEAWFRYFSLEFLRQFGPEYDLLADTPTGPIGPPGGFGGGFDGGSYGGPLDRDGSWGLQPPASTTGPSGDPAAAPSTASAPPSIEAPPPPTPPAPAPEGPAPPLPPPPTDPGRSSG